MQYDSTLKYWVGFSMIHGIGKARLSLLNESFGNLETAWYASESDLIHSGLDQKLVDQVLKTRKKINLDSEMEHLLKYRINVITYKSPDYPKLLKECYDCPPVIFIRGKLTRADETCLAVVGTRKASAYGRQVTEEIVSDLTRSGITIISGLAKGIDTIAHSSALNASGRTIAVFACGLDIVYPAENANLAHQIMENGALISEYPLGVKPKADNFPRRNRILSGMSLGVLVVESGDTGGALITANFALDQNREVFAIPGSIFSPASKGTNKLIQEGAKLVHNYIDIIEEFNLNIFNSQPPEQQLHMDDITTTDERELLIIKCIGSDTMHIDEICRVTGLSTATTSSTLAVMEIKGLVCHTGGLNYVLEKTIKNSFNRN